MPKVSIIVPVYNAEYYLSRCIDSILKQKERDIELILVDDESADSSLDICKEYARLDNRIVVISKKNGGPHSARKIGIKRAMSPYIAFADADDWMKSTLVSDMLQVIEEHQTDGVVCGYTSYKGGQVLSCKNELASGIYNKSDMTDRVYAQMLCPDNSFAQKIIPALWGKLFKKSILLDIMLELDDDIRIGEDLACTFKYMLVSDSIYIHNENNDYIYCLMNESNTTRYDASYFDKAIRSSEFLYRAITEQNLCFLEENIDRYCLYQLYRQIAIAINLKTVYLYKQVLLDIIEISKTRKYQEIFHKVDIRYLKTNVFSRIILQCLKKHRIFFFKKICFVFRCRQKILNYYKV